MQINLCFGFVVVYVTGCLSFASAWAGIGSFLSNNPYKTWRLNLLSDTPSSDSAKTFALTKIKKNEGKVSINEIEFKQLEEDANPSGLRRGEIWKNEERKDQLWKIEYFAGEGNNDFYLIRHERKHKNLFKVFGFGPHGIMNHDLRISKIKASRVGLEHKWELECHDTGNRVDRDEERIKEDDKGYKIAIKQKFTGTANTAQYLAVNDGNLKLQDGQFFWWVKPRTGVFSSKGKSVVASSTTKVTIAGVAAGTSIITGGLSLLIAGVFIRDLIDLPENVSEFTGYVGAAMDDCRWIEKRKS